MDNKTFTDDDLKRWRKELADGFAVERTPLYRIFGTEMDSLLARMEAAEKVVRHSNEIRRAGDSLTFFEKDLIEAWLKTSGHKAGK